MFTLKSISVKMLTGNLKWELSHKRFLILTIPLYQNPFYWKRDSVYSTSMPNAPCFHTSIDELTAHLPFTTVAEIMGQPSHHFKGLTEKDAGLELLIVCSKSLKSWSTHPAAWDFAAWTHCPFTNQQEPEFTESHWLQNWSCHLPRCTSIHELRLLKDTISESWELTGQSNFSSLPRNKADSFCRKETNHS